MDSKRLLIIGASILQLPAILEAKKMGFYVGVVDYNPKAIGIPYADEFFEVSTIDIEGVTSCALKFNPDGIMTLATDMPMRSVASATSACNIPGISMETAIKATDKWEMVKAFDENGVDHPWALYIDTPEDLQAQLNKILYPCIIKPTDNSGSRGVILVNNQEELLDGYSFSRDNSREGKVIIEEYLTGKEVSVEVMAVDGVPHVIQVTDKMTTGSPHFVEMGHTQPSSKTKEDLKRIKELAIKAVKAVGLEAGPAHVEIMNSASGPKMIELGARLGGDCITTHLVPLSTGINMVRATIEIACGIKPDLDPKYCRGSAIRYLKAESGTIDHIENIEEAKSLEGVREITLTKKAGDQTKEIESSIDRVGFVIAEGEDAAEAARCCERALNTIKIVLK